MWARGVTKGVGYELPRTDVDSLVFVLQEAFQVAGFSVQGRVLKSTKVGATGHAGLISALKFAIKTSLFHSITPFNLTIILMKLIL